MTTLLENEQLTRVGPGTVTGDLMREYWIPAGLSTELEVDGPPMRMMLLGENSRDVVQAVAERAAQIQKTLPPGVRLDVLYDRSDFVGRTRRLSPDVSG